MTRISSRIFALSVLLACTSLAMACGSATAPSIQKELDEVRQLNSTLSGQWSDFDSTLTTTTAAIETIPKMSVDPKDLDIKLLKSALTECFDAPVGAGSDASKGGSMATGNTVYNKKCETPSTTVLNDLKSKSSEEIAGFIDTKLTSVAMIRNNVKGKLPNIAEEITLGYPEAKDKATTMRGTVDAAKATADSIDLPEPAMKRFDSDYQAFVSEVTALEETIAKLESEAPRLSGRIATAKERAVYSMTTFGQSE